MKKSKLKVIIWVIVIFGILLFINIYIFTKNFKKEEKIEVKAPSQSEICLEKWWIWNYKENICEKWCENDFSVEFEKDWYTEFFIIKKEPWIPRPCKGTLFKMKKQIEKTNTNELINKNTRTTVKKEKDCLDESKVYCYLYKYEDKLFRFERNSDKKAVNKDNLVFELFENDEKILEKEMHDYVERPISEFWLINEKMFFTFNRASDKKSFQDTYFDWKFLSSEYEDLKELLFILWLKITKGFDKVLNYQFHDVLPFFEIDLENWIVWFLAKRGEKSFVVYKNLDVEF